VSSYFPATAFWRIVRPLSQPWLCTGAWPGFAFAFAVFLTFALALTPAFGFGLVFTLAFAFVLTFALTFGLALAFVLALAFTFAFALGLVTVLDLTLLPVFPVPRESLPYIVSTISAFSIDSDTEILFFFASARRFFFVIFRSSDFVMAIPPLR